MLYLIRSFGRGGKSYLKIGFSDNIADRMSQYRVHNPLFEIISQRQGNLEDETLLHLYLETLGYKANFLNEWFIDTPETITLFHERIYNKVVKVVWRNRETLFTIEDFTNPLKRKIFESLRRYNGKSTRYQIDRDWMFAESKEKLKQLKSKNLDYFDERL